MQLSDYLRKWLKAKAPKETETEPEEIKSAAQARQQAGWNLAQIQDEATAALQRAKQHEIDHWEKNFNFFIQNGVKHGKIGGIINKNGQPTLHPELIKKFEDHGFHICHDTMTYGYANIVIINWALEKPNFYDQDWNNYWMQIGTKAPPTNSF